MLTTTNIILNILLWIAGTAGFIGILGLIPFSVLGGIMISKSSSEQDFAKKSSMKKRGIFFVTLPWILSVGGLVLLLGIRAVHKSDKTNQPVKISNNIINEQKESSADLKSQIEDQLKMKMFLAGLPQEKIAEVHIGGYAVPSGTLETIQQAIEHKIGVKAIIDSNYPDTIPQDKSVFNEERRQFDGDAVWKAFSDKIQSQGNKYRYLVVINEDMFTNIQPERPYIMSRSLPNNNVAIISVKRLQKYSDSNDQPASEGKYKERVEKLALRILGVTAGLSLSPDADNINCLMYQSGNIDELDRVGQDFCETVKGVLNKVFEVQN